MLLAGLKNKPTLDEMAFKSYGNVAEGTACVMPFPASAFTGDSEPASFTVSFKAMSWEVSFKEYLTAKAARVAGGTEQPNVAVLLYGEGGAKGSSVVMLSLSDGSVVWRPFEYGTGGGGGGRGGGGSRGEQDGTREREGTDIQLSADGKSIAIVQIDKSSIGAVCGRLTSLSVSEGISDVVS